jgi:hypothetical protein
MKKIKLLSLLTTLMFISCSEFDDSIEQKKSISDISKKEMNKIIFDEFIKNKTFDWNNLSTENIWNAIQLSDYIVSIAYKLEDGNDIDKEKILDFLLVSEGIKDKEDIVIKENSNLDILLVKIKNKNTIIGLRNMKEVKLIEPAYEMYSKEEVIKASNSVKLEPIKYVTNNELIRTENKSNNTFPLSSSYPSFFNNHNIPNAWFENINGEGIKCAVIDGGVKVNDPVFGQYGNINGLNTENRTFEKFGYHNHFWFLPWTNADGVYETGFQVPSNHGTSMCVEIAGPLGNQTGVAYNADLVSMRASWSVCIDPLSNNLAVSKALENLSKRNDVKVISMSMGSVLPYIWVTRAIEKCRAKGKLIFCAAGTFYLPGVQQLLTILNDFTLFPARLPNVISCTGIKNLESTFNIPIWGNICFGKADFIIEFDETLTSGSQASSSSSTCTTAGMATLIWSNQPSLTANQVLDKMKAASDYPTGSHPFFGYGRLNMQTYLDNEGINN